MHKAWVGAAQTCQQITSGRDRFGDINTSQNYWGKHCGLATVHIHSFVHPHSTDGICCAKSSELLWA